MTGQLRVFALCTSHWYDQWVVHMDGCCACHSGDKLIVCVCVRAFALAIGMTSPFCIWIGCCTCQSCDRSIMCVTAFALVIGMTSRLCIRMVVVLVTQVTI